MYKRQEINDFPSGRYDKSIYIVDVATWKVVKTIAAYKDQVNDLRFSKDGKTFVSAGSYRDDTVKTWDVETGRMLKAYPHFNAPLSVSSDGRYLAAQTTIGAIIVDYNSGEKLATLARPTASITAIAFSNDGKRLITGSSDRSVKIWDITTASLVSVLTGHQGSVTDVALSPDGKYAISGTHEVSLATTNSIMLWDLDKKKSFQLTKYETVGVAFSSDSKTAITCGGGFKTWDVATGKEITSSPCLYSGISSIIFFEDNSKAIVPASKDIYYYNVKTGGISKSFTIGKLVSQVALSPDNKTVAVAASDLLLVDKETGETIWRVRAKVNWHPSTIKFTPDGKYLLTGHEDRLIRVWDAASGRELKQLKGHTGDVSEIAVSPDGKRMVSGSSDNSLIVWDLDKYEPIYTMISNTDGSQWIVFNKEGYWDASPRGGDLVAMVKDLDVYNIDQFAAYNNRPDLILSKAGYTEKSLIDHYTNQYKKRLRRLNIKEEQLSQEFHVPTTKIVEAKTNGKFVDVKFNIADSKYKLVRYNVFANDVPIFGSYGKQISGNSMDLTEHVELTSGENKIEISCMNEKGTESYRAVTYSRYNQPVDGDLYYLAFGVSTYSNPALNLRFAHKDAYDLEKVLQNLKRKGYANVYTKVLANEQVTPDAIRSSKDFIKNAKVDDTFILFVAGHGMHDTDADETYYFLTHNTNLSDLKGTAATFETVEDLLQGISPRNKLFLLDACESGELDEEDQEQMIATATGVGIASRGFKKVGAERVEVPAGTVSTSTTAPKRSYLYQKDRYIYNDLVRRSGAIVFSSSKGGELSYERNDIENGVFTEYIMAALTRKDVDQDKDKRISIDELKAYVSENVAKTTSDLQHPTIDRDNIYQKVCLGYDPPVVKIDIMNIEMVEIKGGTYHPSGSQKEGTVPNFLIGRYEVTQGLWKEIMGYNPSRFKESDQNPVENITYEEVMQFITKLNQKTGKNYRLPNEIEWVVAARGKGSELKFAGTADQPNDYAWFQKTSAGVTHEVGLKLPNDYGLFDMSGNVAEFCDSWKNKKVPVKFYGGSIFDNDYTIWTSATDFLPFWLKEKNKIIGFRLAMSIDKKK